MSAEFRLGDRIFGSSQIYFPLRVVEVSDLTVIIDIYWYFAESVRTTEFAILPFNIHVQLEAASAEEFEALHSSESVAIESQQRETKLNDYILHCIVTG